MAATSGSGEHTDEAVGTVPRAFGSRYGMASCLLTCHTVAASLPRPCGSPVCPPTKQHFPFRSFYAILQVSYLAKKNLYILFALLQRLVYLYSYN